MGGVVRIQSTGISTREVTVTVGGVKMEGVSRVVIEPLHGGGIVKATIEVIGPDLDLQADAEITIKDGGA